MAQLLNADIEKQIRKMFEALKEPVAVLFFASKTLPCEYCEEIRQLITEVTGLSPKLSMLEFDLEEDAETAAKYRVDKAPSFVLAAKNGDVLEDTGVIFSGIPAQYEFVTFLAGLLMVSKRDSGLSAATRSFLATLTRPVNLQVFTTPTWPYCPQAVELAHKMAYENRLVRAEMVEAMEFQDLSMEYGVSGVPHTVINAGAGEIVGSGPENRLVMEISRALQN